MKGLLAIAVCLAIFAFAGAVAAADDLSVSIGARAWYNTWISPKGNSRMQRKAENNVYLVGPSVRLAKGKFFTGISYLVSTEDYEFRNIDAQGDSETMSRSDLDYAIGFMVHPRVGLMTGFKWVWGSSEYRSQNSRSDSDYSLYGFVYGVSINYPVPDTPVVLVLNTSYIPVHFRSKETTQQGRIDVRTESALLAVYEGSAIYALSKKVSANLGYKRQNYKTDAGTKDVFEGFIFGVDYRF